MPTFKKIKYNGAECATAHADHASVADTATNAGHQTTADSATSATTATSATSAGTATSASEAVKLSTARTIQTNLASGTAASFDGSSNVTPGITGILPIANGGTGSSVQNFVATSGNQSIEDLKNFKDPIILDDLIDLGSNTSASSNRIDIRVFTGTYGTGGRAVLYLELENDYSIAYLGLSKYDGNSWTGIIIQTL